MADAKAIKKRPGQMGLLDWPLIVWEVFFPSSISNNRFTFNLIFWLMANGEVLCPHSMLSNCSNRMGGVE